MIAREVMTPNPQTVTPDAAIGDVWDFMQELDVRHIPIVQDDALVGMLSDRDLAHLDIGRAVTAEGADALRRALTTRVIEVMRSDVISVDSETELLDVVGLLVEHKIGAVPVVRPGTRELVGIISYVDVLRVVQDLLE